MLVTADVSASDKSIVSQFVKSENIASQLPVNITPSSAFTLLTCVFVKLSSNVLPSYVPW